MNSEVRRGIEVAAMAASTRDDRPNEEIIRQVKSHLQAMRLSDCHIQKDVKVLVDRGLIPDGAGFTIDESCETMHRTIAGIGSIITEVEKDASS